MRPLAVGDMIHGHVQGYFGRDFYSCSRIEALGADWVVVRSIDSGNVTTAASISRDPVGLYRALVEARDKFDEWFCEHKRPSEEDQ